MRKRLHKTDRINVRLTPDQLRALERAARLESDRRGELVDESTLVREITMAAVDRILAERASSAA